MSVAGDDITDQNTVIDKTQRKHPPHLRTAPDFHPILLITVCTYRRRPVLANRAMHNLFKQAWSRWPDYPVGYYTILPDHLHLMIRDLGQNRRNLCAWVAAWKGHVTRNWNGTGELWQRSFWDRQIRSARDYDSKYLYVRDNPVRHGLVTESEDWPYQGEMNDI